MFHASTTDAMKSLLLRGTVSVMCPLLSPVQFHVIVDESVPVKESTKRILIIQYKVRS
jgi:hypothetical protein